MKYRLLMVGSGEITNKFMAGICLDTRFQLCGVIPNASFKQQSFSTEIPKFTFKILQEEQFDIIFAIEFRRLIPQDIVRNHRICNLHAGILPKYRGFSANAWAIMNGEKEIGYSIHQMNEKMDDGPVYYVKKIPIDKHQTYADVHDDMLESIYKEVPDILCKIASGELQGTKQTGPRIYAHRFRPGMGLISDFNVSSDYLYNLYRCMAEPLGSGMSFKIQNTEYRAAQIIHGENRDVCNYTGIPGKVVNIEENEIWVKTMDNIVILKNITTLEGMRVIPNKICSIGNCLNS